MASGTLFLLASVPQRDSCSGTKTNPEGRSVQASPVDVSIHGAASGPGRYCTFAEPRAQQNLFCLLRQNKEI